MLKIESTKRYSEGKCVAALGTFFNYAQNQCFPNVHVYDWEADFVLVTPANYMWEVEVKLTHGDWKIDAKKGKWTSLNWKFVSRFYYAVPEHLLEKQEHKAEGWGWWKDLGRTFEPKYKIPEHVPEWAGILVFIENGSRLYVREIRAPKVLGKTKTGTGTLKRLYRSTYYRYWNTGKHRPDATGMVNCQDPELLQPIASQE